MSQFTVVVYKISKPTIASLVFSYFASVAAIILNILEIRLIVKKWKKASDFEIVLLNLAAADLLSGFGFLAGSGVGTWSYVLARNETSVTNFAVTIVLFSVSSSVTFVIVIAGERLSAVKHPLKHRLWHSDRRKLFKACGLTWLFNTIVVGVGVLTDQLITGVGGSRNMAYAIAAYLTSGIVIVFVLYTWLGHLVMRRSTRFLAVDNKALAANAKEMKRALKKERATIVVCTLVVVSFLTCHIPFTVGMALLKLEAAQTGLLKVSPAINPLIYFFKGRLEKYYGKRKIDLSSETKTPEIKRRYARNEALQTKIDISRIGQTSGANVTANEAPNGTNEAFHCSETLKIGHIEQIELQMGSSTDDDDTNETFRTVSESLKTGECLETETGTCKEDNNVNVKFQEKVDDILRDHFDQGIVNEGYDTECLNIETTKF